MHFISCRNCILFALRASTLHCDAISMDEICRRCTEKGRGGRTVSIFPKKTFHGSLCARLRHEMYKTLVRFCFRHCSLSKNGQFKRITSTPNAFLWCFFSHTHIPVLKKYPQHIYLLNLNFLKTSREKSSLCAFPGTFYASPFNGRAERHLFSKASLWVWISIF